MSTHNAIDETVDRLSQTAELSKRSFTEIEAAHYLAVSRSFLRQSRMDGVRKNRTPGPPFVRLGRMVRYLREDLDAWLDRHRTGANSRDD